MPALAVAVALSLILAPDDYLDLGGLPAADGFVAARRGREARAIAAGRVLFAGEQADWGPVVVIEHGYYENASKHAVLSIYARLDQLRVEAGALVERGQVIASIPRTKKLHLELHPTAIGASDPTVRGQSTLDPRAFIAARAKLFVPAQEANLLVIEHDSYRLRWYQHGVFQKQLEIGLGQEKGQKRAQGDLRTPKGMYFVISKKKGKFTGTYGEYFGGHWIKINYPNPWDADRGREQGSIDDSQAAAIAAAWRDRRPTLERTRLGGGIGLHGWISEWDGEGGAHLSWGCVVLHNEDIAELFDHLPIGTMVVIQ